MPPIGLALGRGRVQPVEDRPPARRPRSRGALEVAIRYGDFIITLVQFVIVALVVFLMVKAINAIRRSEAASPTPAPAPTPSEMLLGEIRDSLERIEQRQGETQI